MVWWRAFTLALENHRKIQFPIGQSGQPRGRVKQGINHAQSAAGEMAGLFFQSKSREVWSSRSP